ncbi:dihydrolipoyl dehydrogenase [Methyloversatilis sp.]|uniref:dihydrolipoyl dehydrogenase n=1 Tax=Methyloversatilis sp. TaxID=2569862 RepID=UPI0027342CBB|nr:dihydrolipoyl dehydrogenase [Methyloversatilis sp.]MDP3455727.1 dihydrolipoyl dehydrogenase [Methyloversatilis sp.]MDP3579198.1 dihydrolipoyl dehydrogenase [Methyloversatilis sp.]
MSTLTVKIPDIGDFNDVPIIEIMVKPGDTVEADAPLMSLESDKATMDIPAPQAGRIVELNVKVGDRVSEGSVVLTMEAAASAGAMPEAAPVGAAPVGEAPVGEAPVGAASSPRSVADPAPAPASAPLAATGSAPARADESCAVLVLGGGPGGYSAAFRAADLGLDVIIVERYATLGGVCLNVGCIPSKALLHVAAVADEAEALAAHGIKFGPREVDLGALLGWKDKVVGKLTGGLSGMAKARKVKVVRGTARFIDANHVEVALTSGDGRAETGEKKVLKFGHCIVAAGSQAVKLPFMPDDPRVVDSTGALLLADIPKRMLVIGGGIIGLEMATVYSTLGARIDVVEMTGGLMQGADRDLAKVWEKKNNHRFDAVMLNTRVTGAEATVGGIRVTFEGAKAPAEPQVYDRVLVAVGRSPNGRKLNAEAAGLRVDERGFVPVDSQMRTNVAHIHAIGDIVGQPMLAHKAVHEGHVAAEVIAGHKRQFDATVIPSVAYTDPEVAWVGLTEDEAKAQGRKVTVGKFPWAASGRAIANGRDEGFTKLIFDAETGRIAGGGIVGVSAGDMIGEITLAIEMGADAVDIGHTIHPHPTLGESIGLAAEVAEGSCTDLPRSTR